MAVDDAAGDMNMEITQRDIERTAGILWNGAARSAEQCPEIAVYEFTRLATKYVALAMLFCGRYDDTETLFDWLAESARAMADYYLNLDR